MLLVLVLVGVGTACGSAQSSTGTSSRLVTTTTAPTPMLSAAQLRRLVVKPPRPFARASHTATHTGLIRAGASPIATTAGSVGTEAQLAKAHFEEGWASAFQAPDGAAIEIAVLAFHCSAGAVMVRNWVKTHPQVGVHRFVIPHAAGSIAQIGTSPQSRSSIAGVLPVGRFLAVLDIYGPRRQHDYRAILAELAHREWARLI